MSLFAIKPLARIMRESESGSHQLKRTLGAFNLVALGIGAIIGAGLFALTPQAAHEHAGPAVVLSFVVSRIVGEWQGWFTLAAGGLGFWVILNFHHHCRDRVLRYSNYLKILELEVARAAQDFLKLPPLPPLPREHAWPRYFRDLDLVAGDDAPSLIRLVQTSVSTGGFTRLLDAFDRADKKDSEILQRQAAVRSLAGRRLFRRKFLLFHSLSGSTRMIDSESLKKLAQDPVHTPTAPAWVAWALE